MFVVLRPLKSSLYRRGSSIFADSWYVFRSTFVTCHMLGIDCELRLMAFDMKIDFSSLSLGRMIG